MEKKTNSNYQTFANIKANILIKIFGNKPLALCCIEQVLDVIKGDTRKAWLEVAKVIHNK